MERTDDVIRVGFPNMVVEWTPVAFGTEFADENAGKLNCSGWIFGLLGLIVNVLSLFQMMRRHCTTQLFAVVYQ